MLMKQCYLENNPLKLFTFILVLFVFTFAPDLSKAQATYQPYSYQFYQKFNKVQYSWETKQHTAVKPIIIDSIMLPLYDSLMNVGVRERSSWFGRKLWNEHLIDVQEEDFTFYADFIPDFQIGRDFAGQGKTTWLNTRGFQAGGSIKDKFFFYTSGYENQGVFPEYINDYITENRVVPGQMYGKLGSDEQDWTYVSALVSYFPAKNLNFSLAYDKNFIGDGYRSMLLSDISSNSTSFKFNGTFGDISISSIWSYMLDPREKINEDNRRSGSQRKWGAFQYLDWNVDNRFSVGLFHSLLWGNRKSDLESSLLEPGIDYRNGVKSMMQIGLNSKYKVLPNASLYGQLLLNKKMAAQIGFRGFDAFGIKNFNFLGEYNFAKPYTYANEDPLASYSNYSQPLAHPFGANFREFVGILNYSYSKFDFSLQGNYGTYGLDPLLENGMRDNYGKDIYKPYNKDLAYDGSIGQGLKTNMMYVDGRVSYVLNPKYNLRLEVGGVLRRESNNEWKKNTGMLTLGLRASFRNLYYDF